MGHVEIDINDQDEPWISRRKRLEKLASRFTGEEQQEEVHDHGLNREPHDQEVKRLMDSQIYQSIKKKDNADVFISVLEKVSLSSNLSLSAILRQVTPSESSPLHVAARYESGDIIQLLAHFFPKLLFQRNNQGDTPLHEAARVGQLNATEMLIRFAKDSGGKDDIDDHGDPYVSKKNHKWNTALHLAVIHGRLDVANFLVSEDLEVCYSLNKEGSSPLCLAVGNHNTEMLGRILDALINSPSPICDRLRGMQMPPVHLAMKKKAKDKLMKIASKREELFHVRDEKGENPLHFASRIGYVDGVKFMLENYSEAELETNKDGNYPIHLACKKGHVEVLETLLKRWIEEDPTEFRNKKGQNILHIASENGQDPIIEHIFDKIKGEVLKKILNQRDDDGNTPLHLATKKGQCFTVYTLVNAKGMKKRMHNNQILTPYDIASAQAKAKEKELQKDDEGGTKQEVGRQKQPTDANTDHAKNPSKEKRQSTTEYDKCSLNYYTALITFAILYFHAPPKRKRSLVRELPVMFSYEANREEINKKIGNLLVVATLIAGATFSGGLQLPPERDIKNAEGIAAHTDILMTFYIFFDMASFNLAVIAFIILGWSSVLSTKISRVTVKLAAILVSSSIHCMSLAFSSALIIDLADYIKKFWVVITIIIFFLLVQVLVVLPFVLSINVIRFFENLFAPYLYYLIFRIYMVIRRGVSVLDRRLQLHAPKL